MPTLYTFYHSFFPSKAAEESARIRRAEDAAAGRPAVPEPPPERRLVKIRPPYLSLLPPNPWPIMRTLTDEEALSGRIRIPFNAAFTHVLPHWTMERASRLIEGEERMAVTLSDFTAADIIRYPNTNVYFQKLENDDFLLSFEGLVGAMNLRSGQRIQLSWNPRENGFNFRLFPN